MIWSAVISGPAPSGMKSRRTSSASASSTGERVRLANAVTRISAPSSSRIELVIIGRDELEHVGGREQPFLGGLLLQDRDAGLQVGRLDVGQQSPLEPGTQPVLEGGQLPGRAVGGDDDLLVRVVQRVEGVEELLLGPLAVLQELDVVDQQDVDVAVPALERLVLSSRRQLMKSLVNSSVDT